MKQSEVSTHRDRNSGSPEWQTVRGPQVLMGGELHIWRACLLQPEQCIRRLAGYLSSDEQQRASKFAFARDRRRFIVGRGLLRTILGGYSAVAPDTLRFQYGARGKPALISTENRCTVGFNVAHCDDVVIFGVTRNQNIGVDVERIWEFPEADRLATSIFSVREQSVYGAMTAANKPRAFFNGWTRKEAYLKALGIGLTKPLHEIEVPINSQERFYGMTTETALGRTVSWWGGTMAPSPGYVASFALLGKNCPVRYFELSK